MMTTVLVSTIPFFWITFLVYWIAKARGVKPTAEKQGRRAGLAYRVPLILCCVTLWFPFARSPLGVVLTPQTELAAVMAVSLCALGLLVAIWARRTLADNWSSFVTFRQGHELIQTGPYRYMRHPIYTGMLMMCLGTALAGGRIHSWLGFLFMCIAFGIKLKQEESLMLRHFPNDYPAYKNRVKALIPFVI